MKKLSFMVAAMIAFPALVNAQQSLYFGGAPNWNQIQMKTAEGKEVPYVATGQYAAWVLLTDEAKGSIGFFSVCFKQIAAGAAKPSQCCS